jgi:catechol 2,3-dioxygenase-like lactoylglutathione lyase family enzyme
VSLPLGAFSVSLAVKDLEASTAFYEKLGFEAFAGEPEQGWLILRNGAAAIGLFQGMFEGNILTFNPGWDPDAQNLHDFLDVREIQARLKEAGLELVKEADPETEGPAHITLVDPDGNAILIDQHR